MFSRSILMGVRNEYARSSREKKRDIPQRACHGGESIRPYAILSIAELTSLGRLGTRAA